MTKLSDYLVRKLESAGVRCVFMVTGGGAMHLNDSFGKSKKIKCVFNHHEQASAMAAEGYARVHQQLAVVCVTSGPGGLNCLNGVFGAWTDSAPVLFISGQVKTSTTRATCPKLALRQLGDQEVDIVRMVTPVTKYARMLTNPADIDVVLEEAIYHATHGRPGPVWLDIPLNVQAAPIDTQRIKKFMPPICRKLPLEQKLHRAISWLKHACKPLVVIGHGVRLSATQQAVLQLLKQTSVPAVTTFNGFDLLPADSPHFAGRIGTVGQRAGNFTLQNADVVLFLGTRNNIRQISYNWENFAKHAKKIVIDIDPAELNKPTVKPDLPICTDLKNALPILLKELRQPLGTSAWRQHCKQLCRDYPPLREFSISLSDAVHPYLFMQTLSRLLPARSIVTASNGTACVAFYQAFENKPNQRLILNSGDASMGYGLPASLGACMASRKTVICLEGDGSIMMNLQELQTVKTNHLPLKIFILKNGEYCSIVQTQRNFFNGHLTGCNAQSGVEVPDFVKIAKAFGLPAVRITKNRDLEKGIKKVLQTPGPIICELDCTSNYLLSPKLSARKLPDGTMVSPSLEDMFPFLDRQDYEQALF
ncbi:MAG: thiamine pyrophosphate-binding protein [Elusimicrobiaceae bacterium]|nr:thiamine pyrophosphate-binding protein [Elusimicrobiaceae bacterium]